MIVITDIDKQPVAWGETWEKAIEYGFQVGRDETHAISVEPLDAFCEVFRVYEIPDFDIYPDMIREGLEHEVRRKIHKHKFIREVHLWASDEVVGEFHDMQTKMDNAFVVNGKAQPYVEGNLDVSWGRQTAYICAPEGFEIIIDDSDQELPLIIVRPKREQ